MMRMTLILASLIAVPQVAMAATLVPLSSNPGGQPAETSVQQWMQWSFSFDRVIDGGDPITDETGALQNQKQDYPLFMVGGGTQDGVTRSFASGTNKPFLIPMINSNCIGTPEDTCAGDVYEEIVDGFSAVDRLYLSVNDNVLVDAVGVDAVAAIGAGYLVDTGIYPVEVAPNSWITAFLDLPGGTYSESHNIGYYAVLDLPLGEHVVTFGGGLGNFSNSVTARIEVVPLPGALPLMAGGVLMLAWAARRRRCEPR